MSHGKEHDDGKKHARPMGAAAFKYYACDERQKVTTTVMIVKHPAR
jgi:hypothetical protein